MKKAWIRWRENSKQIVMQEMVMTENIMQEVIHSNGEHLEKIQIKKENRAVESIRREKLRKANTAMTEMLRVLKALRSK